MRWAALFKSGPAPDSLPPVLHALPMERSKDHPTAQKIVMVVPWVSLQFLVSQLTWKFEHNLRPRVLSRSFHTNHLCRGLTRWTLIQALSNHQGDSLHPLHHLYSQLCLLPLQQQDISISPSLHHPLQASNKHTQVRFALIAPRSPPTHPIKAWVFLPSLLQRLLFDVGH